MLKSNNLISYRKHNLKEDKHVIELPLNCGGNATCWHCHICKSYSIQLRKDKAIDYIFLRNIGMKSYQELQDHLILVLRMLS